MRTRSRLPLPESNFTPAVFPPPTDTRAEPEDTGVAPPSLHDLYRLPLYTPTAAITLRPVDLIGARRHVLNTTIRSDRRQRRRRVENSSCNTWLIAWCFAVCCFRLFCFVFAFAIAARPIDRSFEGKTRKPAAADRPVPSGRRGNHSGAGARRGDK